MKAYHLFDKWISECRPNTELELFDVYTKLRPIGKERTRNHRTAIKTRSWTDYLGRCIADEHQPTITFPACARVLFAVAKNRLPDLDNMEKALWDAMQRGDASGLGRAIQDDNLIRGYVEIGERVVEPGEEFVWVRFYARRREDFTNYKESYNDVSGHIDF